jgi:hypothetical protein
MGDRCERNGKGQRSGRCAGGMNQGYGRPSYLTGIQQVSHKFGLWGEKQNSYTDGWSQGRQGVKDGWYDL